MIFFPNLFSDSLFKLLARVKRKHHICDECGHSFPKPSKLKRHVDGVHLKLKPFKCEYCNKSFSMAPTLNRHISSKHKKIRHPCDFCDATFSQKGHMNLHIKKNHLERLVVEMK